MSSSSAMDMFDKRNEETKINTDEVPLIDKRGANRTFKRQLVLITEVRKEQANCEHTLSPIKDVIVCSDCGALWLK